MKRSIYANLFVAVVVFFVAAVLVPGQSTMDFTNFTVNTVLVVAVFTFGMMLAYSVSNRQTRLDKIREQLREQDAILLNVYDLSRVFGDGALAQVRERIDQFLQTQIDYQLQDFERSHDALRLLSAHLMQLKTKTRGQEDAKSKILDNMGELTRIHKRVCYNVQNTMMSYEWISLIVLGGIIIFSLFHENQNTWISIAIVTVVSGALVLFLLILKELDSLQWHERSWIWNPLSSLFLDLDLLPYFPDDVFTTKRLSLNEVHVFSGVKRIRIAHYPNPYPDNTGKRVDIVDLKNPV
ncbi:TPA: hypothetical protein HA251_08125 [Candidatus Woesearchaeota archaeon]|nr:hypothetical protein [Candidatus Woesearchaeota archaeon]